MVPVITRHDSISIGLGTRPMNVINKQLIDRIKKLGLNPTIKKYNTLKNKIHYENTN